MLNAYISRSYLGNFEAMLNNFFVSFVFYRRFNFIVIPIVLLFFYRGSTIHLPHIGNSPYPRLSFFLILGLFLLIHNASCIIVNVATLPMNVITRFPSTVAIVVTALKTLKQLISIFDRLFTNIAFALQTYFFLIPGTQYHFMSFITPRS